MNGSDDKMRLASLHREYAAWNYAPDTEEVVNAVIFPQTIQTGDHGLRSQRHIFNGGVYRDTGEIVDLAIHHGMMGLRHVPDLKPDLPVSERLEGKWVYGGFAYRQVGHLLTESIGRLWVLDQKIPDVAGIVFIAPNAQRPSGLPTAQNIQDNAALTAGLKQFREALDILAPGLPVKVIGAATRVDRLIVPSQLMGLLPYGDLLSGHQIHREFAKKQVARAIGQDLVGRASHVYVSRSRFYKPTAAAFFMEDDLDRCFSEKGYDIIYPETISLLDQFRTYAAASHIVMAGGSAAHVAALAMSGIQNIILLRRYTDQNDQFSSQLLGMGALSAVMIDALKARFLPEPKEATFRQSASSGLYVLDVDRLSINLIDQGFITSPFSPTPLADRAADVKSACLALQATFGVDFTIREVS